jgi:hypothetical protein
MSENNQQHYSDLFKAIKERFPYAQFSISCFDTIDEIETKVLNDTDEYIIYTDTYEITYMERKSRHLNKKYQDYFVVKKRIYKNAIYYCDVIDNLISNNFIRDDCDHRFLEKIVLCKCLIRNDNSIKVYGSSWGS